MFNYLVKRAVYTPQNKALIQRRFLSENMKKSIQGAVESAPVVLFMKGTPEFPACGFSSNTIELLSQQGVDPSQFVAFPVLEHAEPNNVIKDYS